MTSHFCSQRGRVSHRGEGGGGKGARRTHEEWLVHAARAGKLGEVDDGGADARHTGQGSSPRTRRSEASLSLARLARQHDKGPTADAPNPEPCQRNVDLGRADPAPRVDQLAAKVARAVRVKSFGETGSQRRGYVARKQAPSVGGLLKAGALVQRARARDAPAAHACSIISCHSRMLGMGASGDGESPS